MNPFKHINFEKKAAIARITLNRPDGANGLDSLMASELKPNWGQVLNSEFPLAFTQGHVFNAVIMSEKKRFKT